MSPPPSVSPPLPGTPEAIERPGRRRPRVLVLGGAGFIGRHVVDALLARDETDVEIGSRHPWAIDARLPDRARHCPRRRTCFEDLLQPADWTPLLAGIDVVVNCVGILRNRGRETYDRVHHRAPAALAAACAGAGIVLLHVSALGLAEAARSGFLRSKQAGEAAIRATGVNGGIVRPSLLDADRGGYGAAWLRRVARWPLLVVPADATGRIAALAVTDLGEALARLAAAAHPQLRDYDFGGDDALPLRAYLACLRRSYGLGPATVLAVPGWLARLGAHACDLVHATPFSFGHWELLRRDNCPACNHLPAVLGRPPRPVGRAVPAAPGPALVQEG